MAGYVDHERSQPDTYLRSGQPDTCRPGPHCVDKVGGQGKGSSVDSPDREGGPIQ